MCFGEVEAGEGKVAIAFGQHDVAETEQAGVSALRHDFDGSTAAESAAFRQVDQLQSARGFVEEIAGSLIEAGTQ